MLLVAVTVISALALSSNVCPHCGYEGRGSYGVWWGSHVYAPYDALNHKFWLVCSSCGQQDTGFSYGTHSGSGFQNYTRGTGTGLYTGHYANYDQCSLCHDTNVKVFERHTSVTYVDYDDTQHQEIINCSKCGLSTTRLLNHSGSKIYEPYNYTYHKVNQAACSVCGRAAHSYTETHTITSYGSWSYYSSTQHVRSGICTLCNDTGYQYATHSDSDGDHKCDVCGGNMPTVVVTLDANGGSCSPSQITVYFGSAYGALPEPTRSGYTFLGWYTTATGGSVVTATKSVTRSTAHTLYAHWEEGESTVSYQVTWDHNDGSGTVSTTTQEYGASLVLPADPSRDGFTFLGWFTASEGGTQVTASTIYTTGGPITYYAQWEEIIYTYQVTWNHNDGSGTVSTTTQEYGASLILPTDPTREDCTFTGWFTAPDGGTQVDSSTVYLTEGPTTYYAHWEENFVFSVTVPTRLDLVITPDGVVYTPTTAAIVNNSTDAVRVSGITVQGLNNWSLMPFVYDMAGAKVNSKVISFGLNGSYTTQAGSSQDLALGSSAWTIERNGSLLLTYTAKVSPYSMPLNELALTLVFVVQWA